MKTLYIVIGSIVVFFIIAQFFIHRSSTKIEFYPYTVAKLVGEIEIRDYQARLFTNVPLANQGYKQNASNGFSKLGGYIFGANERNQKIAMTSPVSMSLGDTPVYGVYGSPGNFKRGPAKTKSSRHHL